MRDSRSPIKRSILLLQLLLGDAHELAGGIGGGEAGDFFEFVVVDLARTASQQLLSEK